MDYLNYRKSVSHKPLEKPQQISDANLKIIDNFLPEDQFKKIFDSIMGTGMMWNYNNIVDYDDQDDPKFQFVHLFYTQTNGIVSSLSNILEPFINLLKAQVLIRVKANLNTRCLKNDRENRYHCDHELVGCKLPDGTLISYTAIYYVNTNNGYTLFKSGEKVDSVANRIVIFDSSKLHKAVGCTDQKRRVVINFNYLTSAYSEVDQLVRLKKVCDEAEANA
mgnify:CR=1 FL=1|tara:strand:+ start:154 stop:816 length:663 start_codon:yes stop_codon:yes gene_type:complete